MAERRDNSCEGGQTLMIIKHYKTGVFPSPGSVCLVIISGWKVIVYTAQSQQMSKPAVTPPQTFKCGFKSLIISGHPSFHQYPGP